MTAKHLIIALIAPFVPLFASAWGQKGHDVTAYIAEQHLTPTTKGAVESLLDGRSIVYWANWLDNASHTPQYAFTKTWHYKNIDKGVRYEEAPANPAGDAVTAIKSSLETLSDPSSTEADRIFALKVLVHVTGDLHQPMHLGHATDLGGNRVKVKFFGRDNNLHSVWDSSIPDAARKWSYTEWQQQIDRLPEAGMKEITDGSIDDWARETARIADSLYTYFQPDCNISYNQIAAWTPTVEQQLLRGGLRLAHLLNSTFDPAYNREE